MLQIMAQKKANEKQDEMSNSQDHEWRRNHSRLLTNAKRKWIVEKKNCILDEKTMRWNNIEIDAMK